MARASALLLAAAVAVAPSAAFAPQPRTIVSHRQSCRNTSSRINDPLRMASENSTEEDSENSAHDRRRFLSRTVASLSAAALVSNTGNLDPYGRLGGGPAEAVGPVKIDILNPVYTAAPCPPSKPIPGEKAMKGMRGLCVNVSGELAEAPPKELIDAGVYGFVNDGVNGEGVLANNPDGGTDAGQFAMIEGITTTDTKKIQFEFVAAVPMEKDISKYENGIGPLNFRSLRIISFPGGQQFGAISPCEMNEFSDECETWENENGPYTKKEFMIKSNPRTKGR